MHSLNIAIIQLLIKLRKTVTDSIKKKNHNHFVRGDFGECQLCTNRFVFISVNVMQGIPIFFLTIFIHLRKICVFCFACAKMATWLIYMFPISTYFMLSI